MGSNSPGLAQGVSDHRPSVFVSTTVSTLVSTLALVFAATVSNVQQPI